MSPLHHAARVADRGHAIHEAQQRTLLRLAVGGQNIDARKKGMPSGIPHPGPVYVALRPRPAEFGKYSL